MYNNSSNFKCFLPKVLERIVLSNLLLKLPPNYIQCRSRKKESVKTLWRLNKENKLLFGSLLETLPQKRKREREKLISLDEVQKGLPQENERSSEIWFWRNTLKKQTDKQISKKQMGGFVERKMDYIAHSNDNNIPSDKSSSPNIIESNQAPSGIWNEVDKTENPNLVHKSNIRLPSIIVNNLSFFPLVNKDKGVNDVHESSSIVSVPMNESSGSTKNHHLEYPSVTRILSTTMSDSARAALQRWKENMIMELGLEGFNEHQRLLLEHGRLFHSTVQQFLSGNKEISVDPAVEGCWHSLENSLKEIKQVKVLESRVVHNSLLYHGIIDCVAAYKGKLVLIEWKKSSKQKCAIWNTYDAPLQVAAYLGAMNFDKNYHMKVDGGLVVVAYTDGSPAHFHSLNLTMCQKYWKLWLTRLRMYWNLVNEHDRRNTVE